MMRIAGATLSAVMVFGMAGAAAGAPPPPDAPVYLPLEPEAGVSDAVMNGVPSNDDMAREYPRIAGFMNLPGRATMACRTLADGRLDDCHVLSEEPEGLGFGAATVRIAAYFHVKPATKDGRPVQGDITIPVRWQMGESAQSPAPPLPPAPPATLALGRQVVALEGVAERVRSGWAPTMQRQIAQLSVEGDAQSAQTVTDAFQLGLNDAIDAEVERQAHTLALHLSEAELKSVVAFLATPAGRAWTDAEARAQAEAPADFSRRLSVAARAHLCPGGTCASTAGTRAKP